MPALLLPIWQLARNQVVKFRLREVRLRPQPACPMKKLTRYDDLHARLKVGEGFGGDLSRAIVATEIVSGDPRRYLVVVHSETLPAAFQNHPATLR
jgi:hypothetical protein